jgi:ferredoxin
MNRVDPTFLRELKEYGAVGIEKCFNCGNCTAICPLASNDYLFPRSVIRRAQIGQREQMKTQLDPWLCYYCGDCSATCPKGAEPGETMMAARRWLTAQYDWTGLSRKLYTSTTWSIGALIVGALMVLGLAWLLHGPLVTGQVELNTFAPVEMIHIADLILAGILAFFLLSNLLRMFLFTFREGKEWKLPPLSIFITEAWQLVYHTLTQQRFSKCEQAPLDQPHDIGLWLWFNVLVDRGLSDLVPNRQPLSTLSSPAFDWLFGGAGDHLWCRRHALKPNPEEAPDASILTPQRLALPDFVDPALGLWLDD